MNKKIIGICILTIGVLTFLWFAFDLYQLLFESGKLRASLQQELVDRGLSSDQIQQALTSPFGNRKFFDTGGVIAGACIAIGGFILFQKNKHAKMEFKIKINYKQTGIILLVIAIALIIISQTVKFTKRVITDRTDFGVSFYKDQEQTDIKYTILFTGIALFIGGGIMLAKGLNKKDI